MPDKKEKINSSHLDFDGSVSVNFYYKTPLKKKIRL